MRSSQRRDGASLNESFIVERSEEGDKKYQNTCYLNQLVIFIDDSNRYHAD